MVPNYYHAKVVIVNREGKEVTEARHYNADCRHEAMLWCCETAILRPDALLEATVQAVYDDVDPVTIISINLR